jgi:hypothetical protein
MKAGDSSFCTVILRKKLGEVVLLPKPSALAEGAGEEVTSWMLILHPPTQITPKAA